MWLFGWLWDVVATLLSGFRGGGRRRRSTVDLDRLNLPSDHNIVALRPRHSIHPKRGAGLLRPGS